MCTCCTAGSDLRASHGLGHDADLISAWYDQKDAILYSSDASSAVQETFTAYSENEKRRQSAAGAGSDEKFSKVKTEI